MIRLSLSAPPGRVKGYFKGIHNTPELNSARTAKVAKIIQAIFSRKLEGFEQVFSESSSCLFISSLRIVSEFQKDVPRDKHGLQKIQTRHEEYKDLMAQV